MKAIMYHYVRPTPLHFPFLSYLNFSNFQKQLDFFLTHYQMITQKEFLAAVKGGPVPQNTIILTFDDGISDHNEYVVSELLNHGLWGIFYIPTAPYVTGKLLGVHRIHCLLGRFGSKKMLAALKERIEEKMLNPAHVEEFRKLPYSLDIDTEETLFFKRTLNYYISYNWRDYILDGLMKEFFEDESDLARQFYIPSKKLIEMQVAGMIIGSHSVNHPVFSKLSDAEQRTEIEESFSFLEKVTGGLKLRTFCYPYGGFYSFTSNTEQILNDVGCQFSFNVESRDITEVDFQKRPQALPRYDCNQFPYGKNKNT